VTSDFYYTLFTKMNSENFLQPLKVRTITNVLYGAESCSSGYFHFSNSIYFPHFMNPRSCKGKLRPVLLVIWISRQNNKRILSSKVWCHVIW
jgi:hypothetical protein